MVEHDQVDAAGLKELGELDQMLERAAEPVELGDNELVAGAFGDQQRLVQLWASGELAAGVVDEDPLAAGDLELVTRPSGRAGRFVLRLISRPTMRRNSADGRMPKLNDAKPRFIPNSSDAQQPRGSV